MLLPFRRSVPPPPTSSDPRKKLPMLSATLSSGSRDNSPPLAPPSLPPALERQLARHAARCRVLAMRNPVAAAIVLDIADKMLRALGA